MTPREGEAPHVGSASAGPTASSHLDPAEVERFGKLASRWWDPDGPMAPLHAINPVRLGWIKAQAARRFTRDAREAEALAGLRALDVGCGAGLLTEPLARMGARVTGLEPSGEALDAARAHAEAAGLVIDYRADAVEAVAAAGERFDLVCALEVVEHVADVPAFVEACAACVAPGGLLVMSTINRTARALALAVIGAEHVLRWLPVGTHDWRKFVTPAELRAALRRSGLVVGATTGIVYRPLSGAWALSDNTGINYMVAATRRG